MAADASGAWMQAAGSILTIGADALTKFGSFLENHNGAITAVATGVIAAFTITLWLSTRRIASDSVNQIELARHELALAHGPKLAVTRITEIAISNLDYTKAVVDIVNYGSAIAKVIGNGGDIFLRPRTNFEPSTFNANLVSTTSTELIPGTGYAFQVRSSRIFSFEEVNAMKERGVDLCLVAQIAYADEVGVRRLISFFRIFDHEIGCFRRPETAAERREWEYPN